MKRLNTRQKVLVNGLRLQGQHGIYKEEQEIGNSFEFNVLVEVEPNNSLQSDLIEDTLNYATLIEVIEKENEVISQTLEHLGGRIMRRIFSQFQDAKSVWLKIEKINPPITLEISSVGIELEECRSTENG